MPDPLNSKTTSRDIIGWCFFSFAAEPFIVSAIGTYIPLLLQQMARNNGVKVIDRATPCDSGDECLLPLFNRRIYIDTASFALYTFSLSVVFQVFTVVSISGLADRGNFRKKLLVWFGVAGGLLTCCFYLAENFYIASLLVVVTNTCFGCVNVCGNSFLPLLAENHPTPGPYISSKISGYGAALGYGSAFFVQILTILQILSLKARPLPLDTVYPLQCALLLVGIWWTVFQAPVAKLLVSPEPDKHSHSLKEYIHLGWAELGEAAKQAFKLKDISIFLVGWFIVSDSLTTINSTAILFASSSLKMSTLQLSGIGMLTVVFAVASSIFVPTVLQEKLHISTHQMLIYVIVWASVIPFYGVLGLFSNTFGLKSANEMYLLAAWYGCALGGLAVTSRSLFGSLIPKGRESVFFSLFSITDKGSSVLGPIVVGLIIDRFHQIRYCFWFLLVLLVLAVPVFKCIDIERGMRSKLGAELLEEL